MNYAEIKTFDVANGPGIRVAVITDVQDVSMNRLGISTLVSPLHRKPLTTL